MRDISGERGRERERENTFELQPTAPPTSCQRSPPFLNSFINTRTIGCPQEMVPSQSGLPGMQ